MSALTINSWLFCSVRYQRMASVPDWLCAGSRLLSLSVVLLNLLVVPTNTLSAEKLLSFPSAEQEALYQELLEELRCLKCQNQNLADSGADLAQDLRDEIHQQIVAGNDRQQIIDYLLQRYGDFVLYHPRFIPSTWALWLGPAVLLVIGLVVAIRIVNRSGSETPEVTDDDLARARSMLDDKSS